MDAIQQFLNRMRAAWNSQSVVRRFMFGLLALLIVVIAIASSGAITTQNYVPLYSEPLAPEEAGAIAAKLKAANKDHKLELGGTRITVPADQLAADRVALAAEGIPVRGTGFEIFDQSQFAVPPDVQRINYLRALQGELARSIQTIEAIQSARVHIAVPDPTPFVRERKTTTASVVLRLKSGRDLNKSQAGGIVALASRAIEGLKPENVTVVDTTGRVLSDNRPPDETMPTGQIEYRKELENYLASKAQTLLSAHLGNGRAIVSVNADIDFKKMKERSRRFEQPGVTGAERTSTSKTTGAPSARGVAGAVSNVRPAGGTTAGGSGTSNEETSAADYLVSTIERELEDRMASVTRITVAALVDLSPAEGDGSRPNITIANAQDTIKQAIGYKQGRDEITVTDARLGVPATAIPEVEEERGILTQSAALVILIRNAALALTALVILAIVASLALRRRPAGVPIPPTPAELEKAATEKRRRELDQFVELARRDPDFVARALTRMVEA